VHDALDPTSCDSIGTVDPGLVASALINRRGRLGPVVERTRLAALAVLVVIAPNGSLP